MSDPHRQDENKAGWSHWRPKRNIPKQSRLMVPVGRLIVKISPPRKKIINLLVKWMPAPESAVQS